MKYSMDKIVCKIDGETFSSEKEMHQHLRKHKMRIVEYYQKYYPRHDKYDGNIIKFKNKSQYFRDDFNTITNLKKWLKDKPMEESKTYCQNILTKRTNTQCYMKLLARKPGRD